MLYLLFGPPGVGKSYIGNLISRNIPIVYFDADTLINLKERELLRNGLYNQLHRDKFIKRLKNKINKLMMAHVGDILVSESFTKESNRIDFINTYKDLVSFILVKSSRDIAKCRSRLKSRSCHVINDIAFDLIWNEFEEPKIDHQVIINESMGDLDLIKECSDIFNKQIGDSL